MTRGRWYIVLVGIVVVLSALVMASLWTAPVVDEDDVEAAEASDGADPGTIIGRVVDVGGNGVAGAVVVSGKMRTKTDSDGAFQFVSLLAGTYRLDASAEGFISPGPAAARALVIELADGEDGVESISDAVLRLARPAAVSGKVMAGATPVAGARMVLHVAKCDGVGGPLKPFVAPTRSMTGADGVFSIGAVPPGVVKIAVQVEGRGTFNGPTLQLADADKRDGIVIDILPRGGIHGMVTSSTGQPLAAEVVVSSASMKRPIQVRAGSDGRYKIAGLSEGPATLVARVSGFRSSSVRVVVGPTALEKNFSLEPVDGVVGRVLDENGRPARGAWVQFSHRGGNRTMRADREGRFSWDRPGVDLATISVVAYTPWHGSSNRGAPKPGEELTLKLKEGAAITGMVVDGNGEPVAGAAVGIARCVSEPQHDFGRRWWPPQRTDKKGVFSFPRVRPGKCDLVADSDRHASGHTNGVWTSSGTTTDNVRITLSAGGTVRGRITSKDSGKPISKAMVVLFEPGSNLPPVRAATDKDGNYELRGVAPGPHSVRVQHRAYLTELRGGVDVPDGGEVVRDLALRKRKPGERFAFQGIGATLGRTPSGVVIRRTMAGSPAAKFGLQNGDVIVGVDHQPTKGLGIGSVVEKIRGEAGTPVVIEVARPGSGRVSITVERGDVVVKGGHGK